MTSPSALRDSSTSRSRYLWIPPLLLALWLFFPSEEFRVSGDGWRYMSRAVGIAEGRGYVDIDWSPLTYRGPLYPAWLSVFFRFLGYEVGAGVIATRVFWVLGALVAYLLGACWFSRAAGALVSLLLLTSSSLASWADQVHIDYPFAVMLLAAILALVWASDRPGLRRASVAGAMLGLAYLFKQTTILLLPLPLLFALLLPRLRSKRGVLWVLGVWGVFVLTVAPWWIHVWRLTGEFSLVGGRSAAYTSSWFVHAAGEGQLEPASALVKYYRVFLGRNYGLTPLLAAGWAGVAVLALRGREWARTLLASGICFLPLLVLQGQIGYRVQQSMIFQMLCYFAMVGVLWEALQRVTVADHSRSSRDPLVAIGLGFALVWLQIGSEAGRWWRFAENHDPVMYSRKSWDDLRPFQRRHHRMGRWLLENASPGTPLLGDMSPVGAVVFYSEARFPVHPMPREARFPVHLSGPRSAAGPCPDSGLPARRPRVLFLWVASSTRELGPDTVVVSALTEEALLATVEARGAGYLVLTRNDLFTAPYYRANPNFRFVRSVSDRRLALAAVRRIEGVEFELHLGERMPALLRRLESDHPRQYARLTSCFLRRELGLTEVEIARVAAGDHPTFRYRRHEWLLPAWLRRAVRKEMPE